IPADPYSAGKPGTAISASDNPTSAPRPAVGAGSKRGSGWSIQANAARGPRSSTTTCSTPTPSSRRSVARSWVAAPGAVADPASPHDTPTAGSPPAAGSDGDPAAA